MTSNKVPDIEKFMNDRTKDFPHMKIHHVPKGPEVDLHVSSERHVKSTVDMEKIKLEEEPNPIPAQSNEEYSHPQTDVYNDMDKFIKPSEYLKFNVLPPMDDIWLIDYNLSLDIRNDAVSGENHTPEYCLQFTRFGNISKIELISMIVSHHHQLISEPYLFIDIKELDGRCHLSNGKKTFGKIMQAKNDQNIIYLPEECIQTFSKPIYLDKLTLSICDHQGTPINIREIKVDKVGKTKSNNELVIQCKHNHYLTEKEKIEVQIIKALEIESYEIEVKSIIDEKKFKIKNSFESLTNQMRIFKSNINLSVTFKFSEINWFVLNDTSMQTTQLVKLSQMIKEKSQSINAD